jgi:hypothetical protein
MKNIIDIYESILIHTKERIGTVKKDIGILTMQELDKYQYKILFDPCVLEDTIVHLMHWKAFDKENIARVIGEMNIHHIHLDDNTIDFYYRLINIHREHEVCDQWMYYYKDVNSAATDTVFILEPVFKENKIYKGYSKRQLQMRERCPSFWGVVDTAEKYVAYYDRHGYVNWFLVPKTLSGEDKVFMENLIKMMVKYNK